MEARNNIFQLCQLLKQEAQLSSFAGGDDKSFFSHCFEQDNLYFDGTDLNYCHLPHSKQPVVLSCLFVTFLGAQWIKEKLCSPFCKLLVQSEPCVMSCNAHWPCHLLGVNVAVASLS